MQVEYLEREGEPKLAYVYTKASDEGTALPTVMFCGGFKSDMMGTKAGSFEEKCKARGQAYLRFDYSGHGMSEGEFKDGTIGQWFADTLAVFDAVVNGPVIIVGSSMGGWIGLLLARARFEFVKGFIGIATAPDFTERLYHEEFNDEQRAAIEEQGFVETPSDYGEPYIFTKALIEDGRNHRVLDGQQKHDYPMTLFHGRADTVVPEHVPQDIEKVYRGSDNAPLKIVYIDDGDHSLSRPEDLAFINAAISGMSGV